VAGKQVVSAEPIRFWLLTLIVASAMVIVPLPAWLVDEYYSRGIFPTLQSWLTSATNLIPFALLDVLFIVVVYFVLRSVLHFFSVMKHVGVMDALWEITKRIIRFVSVVLILFMCFWGFNYRRLPLDTVLPTGPAHLTPEMLEATISDANVLATRLRGTSTSADLTFQDVAKQLKEPMNQALRQLGRTPLGTPGRAKFSLVLTPFFTWTGVDGVINPIALESIVHPDLLPFERPFVLGHEWAHLAGHADEAEASAVGWLACMQGNSTLAYSASLYLIMEAGAALPRDTRQAAMTRLDPGVKSDLDAIADRLQREQPTMQWAASKMYDQYLKVNRIADGTRSYGRALTLILSPPIKDALSTYRPGRSK